MRDARLRNVQVFSIGIYPDEPKSFQHRSARSFMFLRYCRNINNAPRFSGLASHQPMPVFTSRVGFDETRGTSVFDGNKTVASGFASE
jgi:hypothetical protein